MRIGKLVIETYKGYKGDKIYSVSILNKFGGSIGYADPSLLKVFLWLMNLNRI